MSKKLNLSGMLDFSEVDLTAPDRVVEDILNQIPELTNNIVSGQIDEYNGHVTSYKTTRTSLAEALGTITTETHVNIQKSLGKRGEEEKKFECYLYTSVYEDYKYRMFFMKYGIAHYPVQFTLEESIARSIQGTNSNYIVTCDNREEVEELILKILTSKKVLGVMQELIRIHQAKKSEEAEEVTDAPADAE